MIDVDEISGLLCKKLIYSMLSTIALGKPTGILRERAVELMTPVINEGRSSEEKRKFIIEGLNICAAV